MGIEIERKFLVTGTAWKDAGEGTPYLQGYLSTDPDRVVRVRVVGEKGFLTIKGASAGPSRPEFEYEIPLDDARRLLDLCEGPLIEKTRHRFDHDGLVWEVDEFHGANEGLVVAECELESPDQAVDLPPWAGEEVTDDPRYSNSNLVAHPFGSW